MKYKKTKIIIVAMIFGILLIISTQLDNNKYTNELDFINSLNSNNTICFKNKKTGLLTCNNIIEERYSDFGDLIYIKANDEEYKYELSYDDDGVRNLRFKENSIEFYYENKLVSNIKYKKYNKECNCYVLYKNSDIEYDRLYIKQIKNTDINGEEISVTKFNNKVINDTIYVEEISEFKNEKLIRYYILENNNIDNKNVFQIINYVPSAYYETNPYLFVNTDNNLSEYTLPYIKEIQKVIINNKQIEYYYDDNCIYSSNKDFFLKIPKLEKNEKVSEGYYAYKDNGQYYKIKIVMKDDYIKYYEIYNKEIITEEEYNMNFQK